MKWTTSSHGFLYPDAQFSTTHRVVTDLLDGYSAATLRQVNSVSNENGRTLDLCFVSAKDCAPLLAEAPAPLVKKSAHHPALHISIAAPSIIAVGDVTTEVRYNFHRADFDSITAALLSIRWNEILDNVNPDAAVQTFCHVLISLVERHVPKIPITRSKTTLWQTAQLRRLKSKKRKALRKYSRHPSSNHRSDYVRLNKLYKRLAKLTISNHERRTQRKLKTNPKAFWKYVNEQRKENGLPSSMRYLNSCSNSTTDVCSMFANKFAAVFSDESLSAEQINNAVTDVPSLEGEIASIDVTRLDILQAASKLKLSYSVGPDGFPSVLIKRCIQGLLDPLLHIFQLSLSTGLFPQYWKNAYIFPVHKKGPRNDVDNYRGISSLSATSKLFELAAMTPILNFCKGYIANEQHGFTRKRSTTSNLLEFTSYIIDGFSTGVQTDAIYTDLSAAFDKINHDITIAKLAKLGFSGPLLGWIESYLRNRSLSVKIDNCESTCFTAHSGIPQGSHLGPLIFLLYFNDVNFTLTGPRLSYADDLKIYYRIETARDADFLQHQLDLFSAWCLRNRMTLNPAKCSVVSFSRKNMAFSHDYQVSGSPIARLNRIKDLGVLLDSKLTFSDHICYIISKASRNLGFIFRVAKHFRDIYCLKALYCSLVRSILEYNSPVWSPYYMNATSRIESIQRRFVRFALRHLPWQNQHQLPPYEHRCRLIDLDTLAVRRSAAKSLFVADVLAGRIECTTLSRTVNLHPRQRMLRNNNRVFIPYRRTNYGSNSAVVGLLRAFNRTSTAYDPYIARPTLRDRFLEFLRRS